MSGWAGDACGDGDRGCCAAARRPAAAAHFRRAAGAHSRRAAGPADGLDPLRRRRLTRRVGHGVKEFTGRLVPHQA
jgi:hypothetical protein